MADIKNYIGLCKAAGGVIAGSDLVLNSIRSGKVVCVLIAKDASPRTLKQITDKCTFYNIKHASIESDSYDLGKMIGKSAPCAVLGLTGKGPADAVIRMLS
jgi:ribosomal protein L7Ae-like RNA K-turn-binding protein